MGEGRGGDLSNVFIKRPDSETRTFSVAGGGDNSRKLGGLRTEDVEPNGDGTVRSILRSVPGEREVVLSVDDEKLDQEWIQEASRQSGNSTVSYTHTNGSVYSHQAKPIGDMSKNDGNSTMTVTFKGTEIKQDVEGA